MLPAAFGAAGSSKRPRTYRREKSFICFLACGFLCVIDINRLVEGAKEFGSIPVTLELAEGPWRSGTRAKLEFLVPSSRPAPSVAKY